MAYSDLRVDVDSVFCNKCENTLISFLALCEDKENLFNFLYKHGVLCETKNCPKCNAPMWFDAKIFRFQCNKRSLVSKRKQKGKYVKCNYTVSQFKGTFFERHHISIFKICKFVAYWTLLPPPRTLILEQELEITRRTVTDWSNYLREVCYYFIYNNSQPLGGVGKTVEIDEAKIGPSKYNGGRRVIEGNWIFGGIERESKKTFIFPVPNRGEKTLLPIIKKYILPGTTIVSDCWKAYKCLQLEGFQHLRVNHSINFIHPETGTNTHMIEKLWHEVRSGVPRYGNKKHHLHTHIAEFLFKRQFKEYKERIHYLWIAVSEFYELRLET